VIVDCALYEQGHRERSLTLDDVDLVRAEEPDGFIWIGLHEPTPAEFEQVEAEFGLHELAVEDAISAHQRPKLEVYDDTLFIVLKTAVYIDETEAVELGEIQLFIGKGFIVIVRHGQATGLRGVRSRLELEPDTLGQGPVAVLHAVLDAVVDDYEPVMDGIEDDIGEVELEVFGEAHTNPAERIYKLKREVLEMRQATVPLVDPLDRLVAEEIPLGEGMAEYFRDVHDHLLRIVDRINTDNDLLTSALEANLAQISVRQNEDMRKISAWVAIGVVPTVVGAIYGMNFDHMPELGWEYGYPLVLAVTAVGCLLLYRMFRRIGWL